MTFISHAQNFEDVMLWRALKSIDRGFYIDVGAWSPIEDSVTKSFYDKGWSGINVEPNPEYFMLYEKARPRDKNLCLCLGDTEKETEIFLMSSPGLSSVKKEIVDKHINSGCSAKKVSTKVRTLRSIMDEFQPEAVHFLKVDVEGCEAEVIRGNDWSKYRPWIVVVEATLPMSQTKNYDLWESELLKEAYLFAYDDGLNRFYIAEEHLELLSSFDNPPNVFDNYKLYKQQSAEDLMLKMQGERDSNTAAIENLKLERDGASQRASELEVLLADEAEKNAQKVEKLYDEIDSLKDTFCTQIDSLNGEINRFQSRLDEAAVEKAMLISERDELQSLNCRIYSTKSWRITYPLRVGQQGLKNVSCRLKGAIKSILMVLTRSAMLRRFLKRVLAKHPTFRRKLQARADRLLHGGSSSQPRFANQHGLFDSKFRVLGADKVYLDIKKAIDNNTVSGE